MTDHPNIYASIIFDLHKKVRNYLEQLDAEGQIDRDSNGYPYLIKVEKQGPNFVVYISRNNRMENFVLNPRKRAEPIKTWKTDDGFERQDHTNTVMIQKPVSTDGKVTRERRKVKPVVFEHIVKGILDE